MFPTFTIITATRNASATLPRLFASLVAQTFTNFEWVVQDGNSTDDTLDLIKQFQQELPHMSCISEQDTGIYDAWNKALLRVRGKWVLFLGADDCLHDPDALKDAAESIAELPDTVEYFASALVLTLPSGERVETWYPAHEPLDVLPSCMPLPHPALFHRKRLFEHARFDPTLRIAGDYDFLCRTLRHGNIYSSTRVITRMSVGGISGSLDSMLTSELECWHVSRRYFPYAFPCKLYARMCRSALYKGISTLAGEQAGRVFADGIRRLQGKVPLWTRDSTKGPSVPALPQQPHITLVVTTYKRTDLLRRLFVSLVQQQYTNFTVLLGDQNPEHYLHDILKEFANTLTIEHHYIQQQSLSRARNMLLPFATGDLIAFTDDDCYYATNTLKNIVGHFSAQDSPTVFIANANGSARASQAYSRENKFSVFNNAPSWVLFFRKCVIDTLGPFDESLGIGCSSPYQSGEETDYVLRALEQHYTVSRNPDAFVYHDAPDYAAPHVFAKTFSYALGRMYLLKKHNFPLWFKLANVLYPLALLPLDAIRQGKQAACYRWAMFKGRLQGLFL